MQKKKESINAQIKALEYVLNNLKKELNKEKMVLENGSITLRKDGRWMGRHYVNGKVKCVYAHTKLDCMRKLEESIKNNKSENNSINKFYDFSKWYLYNIKKNEIKATSFLGCESRLNKIKTSDAASKSLSALSVEDVAKIIRNEKSIATKKLLLALIREILKYACDLGKIKVNVAAIYRMPKQEQSVLPIQEKKRDYLTEEEIELVSNLASGFIKRKYAAISKTLLYSGMRVGEALALQKKDIDFENKTIRIYKTLTQSGNITSPKSKTSNRDIPLFSPILTLLEELCENKKDNDLIFGNVEGRSYSSYLKNCGLHSHMFRKTFTNIMHMKYKLDDKIIQKWLGHSSSNVTASFYSNAKQEQMNDAAKYVNNMLDDNEKSQKLMLV